MVPLVPGTWYQVPGTRYQVPGTRYQVPGTVPDTWYLVPGTWYQGDGGAECRHKAKPFKSYIELHARAFLFVAIEVDVSSHEFVYNL